MVLESDSPPMDLDSEDESLNINKPGGQDYMTGGHTGSTQVYVRLSE